MKSNENKVNVFQQPGKTKLVKGSILTPENGGLRLILSVNNLVGKPEGNPLLAVFDKKWKKVREEARGLYANKTGAYKLGALVGTTSVQSDVWVLHMLVQDENLKVDTKAVDKVLQEVCKMAKYERATVHVSTLLTEAVPELTELLNKNLVKQGVSVYTYEETA